ncbi:MAG TPA: hypothetical protein VGQ03_05140 [Nitrososphaera sp.]|jgi:hypothetical protein|nr:hypothetical protein [Nitrososphaera sp.]
MSSDNYLDENFGKALDFLGPKVDSWIKELFKGFEALQLTRPQKDLFQGLTVETMLYNTLMPNDEILSVLAGIIQNIARKHSYGNSLDWGKRAEVLGRHTG